MTADQVFFGLALTLVLAVGSQVLASRLRIPALIVLLPVGFVAGALTNDINPNQLLGQLFQPLVGLAVAVILFDSGVEMDLRKLQGSDRRVVLRLIGFGVPITMALTAVFAALLLGVSERSAIMIGAILVVSGPTVVGPVLRVVRPTERVQRVLTWEGALIDPVGGILGALVFHAIVASRPQRHPVGYEVGQFLASVGVGVAGGVVGIALLWLLLRKLRLPEVLATQATIASVIAVAAACDILREDTGLIAAILMGLGMANLRGFDVAERRPFFETVIQLIIGTLFISISATVTPSSIKGLVLPTLALVAVLVLVARPLVALISTLGISKGERGFVGWMDPRGIIAASTASAFSVTLVAHGIGGASKILPVTFLVIVATVTLYGLTAAPVARLLRVTRPARARPLLVGGVPWVIELGEALESAGLEVIMWAGLEKQRDDIRKAGLELAGGDLLAAATGRGAELEGVTAVLLLTGEDDFNVLASTILRGNLDRPVYRVAAPPHSRGVIAPSTGDEVLFGESLTGITISVRHHHGARIVRSPGDDPVPDGYDRLFVVRADGRLAPVTQRAQPAPETGDTLVLLGPARQPAPRIGSDTFTTVDPKGG